MSQTSKPVSYGGQAVIEGVMFGGKRVNVTAVRRKNGDITFLEVPRRDSSLVNKLRRVPLLRGIVSIIDASAKGTKHLNYSADAYAEDEMNPEERAAQQEKEDSKWSLSMIIGVAAIGILSFLFGKLVLTLVPVVVEDFLFGDLFTSQIGHNLAEGVIKLILLLAYLWGISQTPMIKRLFQYHGAEHKVISAYEAGVELTPENVQKFSRLHYRCGSSFIMLTVIIGVIVYSLFTYENIWERMGQRIILLPVVLGLSFEFLKLTNSLRDVPVLRYLGYPGLWLQLLTTKEPSNDQVEVSIASFQRMLSLEAALEKAPVEEMLNSPSLDPVKG
ncbi:DUF1385 domain-containing protein [Paenibacillus sp. P96]|uniref:DUF1385 domain-containing protein n=1 Tax=Paenibacillus zeirhizosphaerae TaxID=2987519 RepID=A0ABT9FQ12_9BACL|nr:DUF1385 domain-containing protein [Paenibacillus sp. P96]MDP4096759.1 DUF1385 domain-containing protein [Paenibacillus sp. P96]